jgi:hypothetical protein
VPHGRWQTMTFMAALRHDRITAPWFIEGPINGEAFLLYIEKVLVPTLRHGDIASWTISARTTAANALSSMFGGFAIRSPPE